MVIEIEVVEWGNMEGRNHPPDNDVWEKYHQKSPLPYR